MNLPCMKEFGYKMIIEDHKFTVDKENYVSRLINRVCLMSLMDEDYYREPGILNRSNPIDLVFQSEYVISHILKYC